MRPQEGDERDRRPLPLLLVITLAFIALASTSISAEKQPVERREPPPLPPRGPGQRLAAERFQLAGSEEQDIGRGRPKRRGAGERSARRRRQQSGVEFPGGQRVGELAEEAEGQQQGPGMRQERVVGAASVWVVALQEVPEGEEASAREQACGEGRNGRSEPGGVRFSFSPLPPASQLFLRFKLELLSTLVGVMAQDQGRRTMTPPGGMSAEAERPRVEEQAASPARSTRDDAFDCGSSALVPEQLIQRTRPAKASRASLGARLGSAESARAVVIVADSLDALRI